jgi:hypothetical protein
MADLHSISPLERAEQMLQSVNDAISWTEEYGEETARQGMLNALKSTRRSVKNVISAALKRPGIAIFGQSQVGKSYLVQNLTKPADSPYLKIRAGESVHNFITDINPPGGKESTGTVTRFTCASGNGGIEFPIRVELLSPMELAAILVNGYLSDLKDFSRTTVTSIEELRMIYEEIGLSSANETKVDEDDVHAFVNYIHDHFVDHYLIRELGGLGYFKELPIQLIKSSGMKSWKMLELLWERNEFLTSLYRRFFEALQTLKSCKSVYVQVDSISPNSSTILDVERVHEIFSGKHGDIKVQLSDKTVVTMPRSLFSAITKEVELVVDHSFIDDPQRSFLESTDLLDFPGSKSREKIPVSVFNSNSADQKLHLFIRGKVSFLFDSYTNNLGVSSLLYCMDDSPPEEKEAPARLARWIGKYIGPDPAQRRTRLEELKALIESRGVVVEDVSPLLIVMTKFNEEMNKVLYGQGADIEMHDAKWNARFQENFALFMSRPVDDKWVLNWKSEGSSFRFVFPIRDPQYSTATFEGFFENGIETGQRPERSVALTAMGQSFIASSIVQQYVPHSEMIWREIITPNQTGINYLSKYLALAANPAVTESKLTGEIDRAQTDLINILKPHLFSGDIDKDLQESERIALISWTVITAIINRINSPFSRILQRMQIRETEIWNLFYDFKFGSQRQHDPDNQNNSINLDLVRLSFHNIGVRFEKDITLNELNFQLRSVYGGMSDAEIHALLKDAYGLDVSHLISNNTNNIESNGSFTSRVMAYWSEKVMDVLINDLEVTSLSAIQREAFTSGINEILKARYRFKLPELLDGMTQGLTEGVVESSDFDAVASCYCGVLNRFLFSAGWNLEDEESKPLMQSSGKPVFSLKSIFPSREDILTSGRRDEACRYADQWALGVKFLFRENVNYRYGIKTDMNISANVALADIMRQLQETS